MKRMTAGRAVVRGWLRAVWQTFDRSRTVTLDDAKARETLPYMVADLARFCCAFDSTHIPGDPLSSQLSVGKREVWLHFCEMADIDPADLPDIKRRTEDE